jgi:hypothetical protein
MDKLLAMLAQSSLDTQQSNLESKQLREELREQREQSKYDIDRLYRSTSNLEERMNGVLEDLEKREDQEGILTDALNTSPNRHCLAADADSDEQGGGKVFSSEPALKVSPIDQVSDQSRGEEHFFLDSANYGFQKRAPLKKRFGFDSGRDASRRESKVISDMMYNIQRSEAQNVYKMVTAEPFTKKLSKLDITHFLWWYTNWNDHMILNRT